VRRAFAVIVAAVLAMLLQTTVLPAMLPRDWVPNLILVLVVWLALHQRGAGGAVGAFLLGWFLDTFSGTLLGVHAFACTVTYLAVWMVGRTLWTDRGVSAMGMVFVASGVHLVAALTIAWLVEAGAPLWHHAWRWGLAEAGLAAAAAPFVFGFLGWEQRRLGLE
jgi:rod shape-determining protein MreD